MARTPYARVIGPGQHGYLSILLFFMLLQIYAYIRFTSIPRENSLRNRLEYQCYIHLPGKLRLVIPVT